MSSIEANHNKICVDYQWLNVVTIKDLFSIPFIESIPEEVARNEMYSFVDRFPSYYQINIGAEDKLKTTFALED